MVIISIMYIIIFLVITIFIDLSKEINKKYIYYSMTCTFTTIFQLIMSILYYPCRINSSFPFHQKTADMRSIDEEIKYTVQGKASIIIYK